MTRHAGFESTLRELTTRPLRPSERDDRIAFSIYLALGRDPDFVAGATDIVVRVVQGVATIQGNTTTPEERTAAERIAGQQIGVIHVDNQLRLPPPPARARAAAR